MDQVEPVGPYDRIEVLVGDETIHARPVKWNSEIVDGEGYNADGELAKPIEYEGVCPECGQMIHFSANLKSAKCSECGVGEDVVSFEDFNPFQDPGVYGDNPEVDVDELEEEADGLSNWEEAVQELDLDQDPDEPHYGNIELDEEGE